ncbi:MAG: hypothetical protein KGI71_05160 [Patescibacteria group bacterium]|nr:hypothetical protein [Patescibacteria group bacterium]
MARFTMTRDFYIPANAIKIAHKTLPAVVYLSTNMAGRPYAVAFVGKKNSPEFNCSFPDERRRAEAIAKWFVDVARAIEAQGARKEQRRAERRAFRHALKVGDILKTNWGYDQTNIEYFQVTKLIGHSMVEVREIAQETQDTGYLQGKCVPAPSHFIGKPLRKRVLEGNCLDIHGGFGYAHLETPKEVAGAKVYGASHWTAYA